MHQLFRLKNFLYYQYKAKTKYYLHSPFVYQFYLNVLELQPGHNFNAIEQLRSSMGSNNAVIEIEDLGTGGRTTQTLANIEKQVAIPAKYGEVLYRIVKYLKPKSIIELGTSTGLSACYLALAAPDAKVYTLEGSVALTKTAQQNFAQLSLTNIEVITGNFDNTLKETLKKVPGADMIFFDGNHSKEATLRYFELCLPYTNSNSVFIFDDIHHSPEMLEAWQQIKLHPKITLTLDIFRMGFCFFMTEKLAKENFLLRY